MFDRPFRPVTAVLDLLGRRLDDPLVAEHLGSLGEVVESRPEEEQGPEHYTAVLSAGVELLSEEGRILAITLYQDGHHGYGAYTGPLPLGLRMDLHRADVRDLLGTPQFEHEPMDLEGLGRVGACDRYDEPAWSAALDYEEGTERILAIQLLLPEAVPA